jgi:hypothetical protein
VLAQFYCSGRLILGVAIITAAMMRKLIHVAFGVLKFEKPFDPAMHGS